MRANFWLLQKDFAEARGFFCHSGKKGLVLQIWAFYAIFWCLVVTLTDFLGLHFKPV